MFASWYYLPSRGRLRHAGSIRVPLNRLTDTCALRGQTAVEDLPRTPRSTSLSFFTFFFQMLGSLGTQATLGLAAGCCLISSVLAELEADNPGADHQEKQVGKICPSSSKIAVMHRVVS